MQLVMEKNIVKSGDSSDVFHKVFLVKELRSKGFDKSIMYKSANDIAFLNAIKNADLNKTLKELEEYLYSL